MGIDSHNMESFVAKTEDKEVDCQIANNKKKVGKLFQWPQRPGVNPYQIWSKDRKRLCKESSQTNVKVH